MASPGFYRILFSSPFEVVEFENESDNGALVFRTMFPDPVSDARGWLWDIEQLLFPNSKFPKRRSTKQDRQFVISVDDTTDLAYTTNASTYSVLHLSLNYCASVSKSKSQRDCKHELAGVCAHEFVHGLQFDGNGRAPGGLIEGIADYVRLRLGLGASHWDPAQIGRSWDEGYEKTAFFLDWISTRHHDPHFVARLNRAMEKTYEENMFEQLTGETLETLWSQYKASIKTSSSAPPAMPTHQP